MGKLKDLYIAQEDFDVPDRAADWDRLIGTDEEELGPMKDRLEWDGNPDVFPDDSEQLPF
ncbi:hypothetical protein [Sphingobium sp. KCTC 72723]|uniref:hypothetical protein n=1 Tax=Sphingobium sp. KCTC 72723 TaxID=2733867 RepID=UPI00165EA1E0|nr:hypothetical protein [Sphingobium sp. KCTC 72723]